MPLAVEITFGNGRYAASDTTRPSWPEWPPHPIRLFCAMLQATSNPDPEFSVADEEDALMWLERQGPPTVTAPRAMSTRRGIDIYVPVNDYYESPDRRMRQARMSVPSTWVGDERVVFGWPGSDPSPTQRAALASLLDRVTRIGHSTSLTACRLTDTPPDPTWVPQKGWSGREFSLRVPYDGFSEDAEERYRVQVRTGINRLPVRHEMAHYRLASAESGEAISHSQRSRDGHTYQLDDAHWLIFEIANRRDVSATSAVSLAAALRGALCRYAAEPAPHTLVARDRHGKPTSRPHALFLSLPFVGHRHADGLVKGLAVLLPATDPDHELSAVYDAVNRWEEDNGGSLPLRTAGGIEYYLRDVSGWGSDLGTLVRKRWSGPATHWASVTPLALARDEPWKLTKGPLSTRKRSWREAERAVYQECERMGHLPPPSFVEIGFSPPVTGGLHVSYYPRFGQGKGEGSKWRTLLHAEIVFPEPVKGPLVLGTGRHRGLGLMWPLDVGDGA